jgi:hypothetical protein
VARIDRIHFSRSAGESVTKPPGVVRTQMAAAGPLRRFALPAA